MAWDTRCCQCALRFCRKNCHQWPHYSLFILMLSRLAMLHRLSDCFFFTLRCQPALVRVLVTLCASAMMEFMPCATRPCLWRDFDLPLRPGCHHPSYHSDFLVKTHLPPLVSFVSLFFSLSPSVSASAVLIRPSSFFGPSPCLLAAGAYCRTFSPVRLVFCGRRRIRTSDVPRFQEYLNY